MKIKYIVLFGIVAAMSSCSTAYRSGQTPDDVYYSPAPEQNSYVSAFNDQDRNSYSYRNDEEAEIRRGIQNPVYRNSIALGVGLGYNPYSYSPYSYNPYGYGNSLYGYGYDPYMSHGMYSPYSYSPYGYNSYSFYNPYNSFYSPYSYYGSSYYGYMPGSVLHRSNVNTNTGPRRYNLNPYNSGSVNNSPIGIRNGVRSNISRSSAPVTTPGSRGGNNSGVGNVIRRVFTPSESRTPTRRSNNNYNTERNNTRNERPTYEAPTRTFEQSAPARSSAPSDNSNSGSAPVRTFRR